jgi:hypothetical protein
MSWPPSDATYSGVSIGPLQKYDTCVATEFDRLLMAHLSFLAYIPGLSYNGAKQVVTRPTAQYIPSIRKQWHWGRTETRFVPDKRYCAGMITVLVVMLALMGALRRYTWPRQVPDGPVDVTTPWSASLAQLHRAQDGAAAVKQERCIVRCDPTTGSYEVLAAATSSAT